MEYPNYWNIAIERFRKGTVTFPSYEKQPYTYENPSPKPLKWKENFPNGYREDDVMATFTHQDNIKGTCVLCGEPSGNLYVLDFDNEGKDYKEWLSGVFLIIMYNHVLMSEFKKIQHDKTPSGGYHLYFRLSHTLKESPLKGSHLNIELLTGTATTSPTPGYKLQEGGNLLDIPLIPDELFNIMIEKAQEINTKANTSETAQESPLSISPKVKQPIETPPVDYKEPVSNEDKLWQKPKQRVNPNTDLEENTIQNCEKYVDKITLKGSSTGTSDTVIYIMTVCKWGFRLELESSVRIVHRYLQKKGVKYNGNLSNDYKKAQCPDDKSPGYLLPKEPHYLPKPKKQRRAKKMTAKEIICKILHEAENHELPVGWYEDPKEGTLMCRFLSIREMSETAIRKAIRDLIRERKIERIQNPCNGYKTACRLIA